MKKKISQAWDGIEPDVLARDRMLENIQAQTGKEQPLMKKQLRWLAPLAACLILAVAAVAVFQQLKPAVIVPGPGTTRGDEQIQTIGSLPPVLAGQNVKWVSRSQEDQSAVEGSDAQPGPEVPRGITEMIGELEDGRILHLDQELLFSGTEEGLNAYCEEHEIYDFVPSDQLGGTLSYTSMIWEDGGTGVMKAEMYRVYIASIE